jgi:hypothetical protein
MTEASQDLSYTALEPYLTAEEKAELQKLLAQDTRLFYPTPGPQYAAATSEADIIGYGGAAGGGKSWLVTGLALTEHKRSVIFRQHKNQTRKFVQDFAKILGNSDGYSSQNSEWKYQDRLIEFGGLEDPSDHEKWQGRDHSLKAYDEATQMRESDVRYTMGWCRSDDPDERCRVVITFNPPTTAEGRWVIKFFAPWLDKTHPRPARDGEIRWFTTLGDDPDFEVPDGRRFVVTPDGAFDYDFDSTQYTGARLTLIKRPKSRTFITARVTDNPYYVATGYIGQLQNLPEPLRSQMLEGDFLAGVEDDAQQVIPTSWVEAAQQRWTERKAKADFRRGPQDALGVDAARGGNMGGTTGMTGKDKLVISPRYGTFFDTQIALPGVDVNTGNLAAAQILAHRRDGAPIQLDVAAIGTSILDALQENGIHVVALNGTAKSFATDKSNLLRFFNMRAQLHWRMREALDPALPDDEAIALPPDPELLADLTAARWSLKSNGIQIEEKAEIKKRLGRSPDKGEACMYANVHSPKRVMTFSALGATPRQTSRFDEDRLKELEER